MAQIDLLIARLVQSNATSATMRTDAPVEMDVGGRRTQGSVIAEARLQSLVQEILPETKRSEWDDKRVFTFPYSSPNGVFEITVNPRTEKLEVSLRPAGASTKTSASDAEMPAAIPTTIPAAMPAPRPVLTTTAASEVLCQKCGGFNPVSAVFCSSCGHSLKPRAGATSASAAAPASAPAAAPAQNVARKTKPAPTEAHWAKLPAFFTPPTGCLTIPLGLITIGAISGSGLASIPVVLAFVASYFVWKSTTLQKKERRIFITALGVAGMLLTVGLDWDRASKAPTGTSREQGTESTEASASGGENAPASKNSNKDIATVDEVTYATAGLERMSAIKGPFSETPADGEFVIVSLLAGNDSKESHTLTTSLIKLLDSQGREFSTSSKGTTALMMSGDKTVDLGLTQVQPGLIKVITLVYDIPPSSKDLKIKIPAGSLSLDKDAVLELD